MDGQFTAEMIAGESGGTVVAEVVNLDREDAKWLSQHWGTPNWWSVVESPQAPLDAEPDYSWDWTGVISREVLNKPMGRSVCLKSPDGTIQGAMIYRLGAKSALEPGKKAVFVDRLATAPLNRSNLVEIGRFRGVGESLLRYAVVESLRHGSEGRVILFPVANLGFYERQGFTSTNRFNVNLDVQLFELPSSFAQQTLRRLGVIS